MVTMGKKEGLGQGAYVWMGYTEIIITYSIMIWGFFMHLSIWRFMVILPFFERYVIISHMSAKTLQVR